MKSGERNLKEECWKYKIKSRKGPVVISLLMFAVFGGITLWLYSNNNGAFIFTGLFSAILMALVIATCHRLAFFKVLIGKDGFYYQTSRGNGKFYSYNNVKKAWINTGEAQNRTQQDYCNIEIPDIPIIRFQFFYNDEKGVDYLINRIEKTLNEKNIERNPEKEEYIIDGKNFVKTRFAIAIVLLIVVAIIDIVIIKMIGRIYLAVPGTAMALFILIYLINSNRYFKVKIDAKGFYCRTNPFNGRYYLYTEITNCRRIKKLVHHKYHVGDADLPSYFFFFEFTDASEKKRRFQFEDPIHGHEINLLKERIERANSLPK